MRSTFEIVVILIGLIMLSVSANAGENNMLTNSKWKKFGTFNKHGEYLVLYNKNGAILKSVGDIKRDKLYLGKN